MNDNVYNVTTRYQIPKDYKCCWNCRYIKWPLRCGNKENEYRVFRIEYEKILIIHHSPFYDTRSKSQLKYPAIPGVAKYCERYENKYEKDFPDEI